MDKVSEQLWLADISSVMTKDVGHFDLVLTICEDDIQDLVACDYKQFSLSSATSLSPTGEPPSFDQFSEAVDALHQALTNDKSVLTHCHSGTSRSVAVASAGFARHQDTTFGEALETIEEARPTADPSELYRDYGKRYVSGRCSPRPR